MISLIFSLMFLLSALGLSIYYEELPVPERLIRQVECLQEERQSFEATADVVAELRVDNRFGLDVLEGATAAKATNLTEEGKAQNRRVEIIIRPTG